MDGTPSRSGLVRSLLLEGCKSPAYYKTCFGADTNEQKEARAVVNDGKTQRLVGDLGIRKEETTSLRGFDLPDSLA